MKTLLLTAYKAIGKQSVHQHGRSKRGGVVGIGFGVVGRHFRFLVSDLETRTRNERGNETVCFSYVGQLFEHQIARIVVALDERITQ